MGYHCQCGKITGVACTWYGPTIEMVVLEWMPHHLRASHAAAKNSGVYPTNGAERIAVERSCAEALMSGTEVGEWPGCEWISQVSVEPMLYIEELL